VNYTVKNNLIITYETMGSELTVAQQKQDLGVQTGTSRKKKSVHCLLEVKKKPINERNDK